MSALAEALVAAQRRALSALSKSYVHLGDEIDRDTFRAQLYAIGLTDKVEQDQLIACLDVTRAMGGAVAAETNGSGDKGTDLHTEAQATLIDKMWKERGGKPGDKPILTGLTKADASRLIDQLKTNTYNVADWEIPF